MRWWITRCSSGPRWRPGGLPWRDWYARTERPAARKIMTFYEELGLSEGASREEIRRAYKRLAKLLHPDRCGDTAGRALAELQMRRLNGILAMLSAPVQRTSYNRSLREIS